MRLLTYMIGEPGAGKSSVFRALTNGMHFASYTLNCPHLIWYGEYNARRYMEIGRRREPFSGTDALSMSIQPKALQLLADTHGLSYPAIAEGDRLANVKFWDAARALDYDVRVVYLYASAEVAAQRRAQRGTEQNEQWLKGRRSKVAHLVDKRLPDLVLNSDVLTPEEAAELLRVSIHEWNMKLQRSGRELGAKL